jgi:hypothetical protein
MGTQQRSDVMGDTARILADVNAREASLKNIYNTETNNLRLEKQKQINQVSMWFADAQKQIQAAKNEGKFQKSQSMQELSRTLLDNAMSEMNRINSSITQKEQALNSWATGINTNIAQTKAQMEAQSKTSFQMPQAQTMNSTPSISAGSNGQPVYGGGINWSDPLEKFNAYQGLFGGQ